MDKLKSSLIVTNLINLTLAKKIEWIAAVDFSETVRACGALGLKINKKTDAKLYYDRGGNDLPLAAVADGTMYLIEAIEEVAAQKEADQEEDTLAMQNKILEQLETLAKED
jgi:hypothetical protein